jgi:hypothetical protein
VLPSIRLVIAAIAASVVLMMGGFGLVATFQIAKTSIGASRGALPPGPVPADRPERDKVYASTGMLRVNEGAAVLDMPSTHTAAASRATNSSPAGRSDDEDAGVRTPANLEAAGPADLVSSSRSEDAGHDPISGTDARPERPPAVGALTEDVAPAIEHPSAGAAATTAPSASDERPAGMAIPVEAPTPKVANTGTTSSAPAVILLSPDVLAAAVPRSPEHEAMETASPSRSLPEVGSSSTPVETAVAASSAGEETARSTADKMGAPPTPLGGVAEAAITPNAESPKATATKGKRATKATKPHAEVKRAKARQATTSKGTGAHVRRRRIHAATQSAGQPQNLANPFGNFLGSQQVRRWPSETPMFGVFRRKEDQANRSTKARSDAARGGR